MMKRNNHKTFFGMRIIPYICIRIDVERFVLLATTGKNAKMSASSLPCPRGNPLLPPSVHHNNTLNYLM
jgi:hypothetical protein